MTKKVHYKLYKAGKYLCTSAIVTAGIALWIAKPGNAFADNNVNVTVTSHDTELTNNDIDTTDTINSGSAEVANNQDQVTSDHNNNSQSAHPANGWFKSSKGNWTYYTNNQVTPGRDYVAMPTINGTGTSWYLMDNGVAQWGVQRWAGTYYYFDPQTYTRVDNNYVQSQWGDWYMFGPDGRIATKVYQWYETYYYFDPITYLRVDNDYRQSQWGLWYMFGKNGRIVTGPYKYMGGLYYFDPSTYLRVDNTYVATQPDGRGYLLGADGRALTGVQQWYGSYYYFDPTTYLRVDNNYVQSQWGSWYMFGPDGKIVTGLKEWYGNYYYFDPTTYLKVTNTWIGDQYFGSDGARFNGRVLTLNNKSYYFDDNHNVIRNQDVRYWGLNLHAGNDGVFATDLLSTVRQNYAQRVNQMIQQKFGVTVSSDWRNQLDDFRELAVHDVAQLVAQGDLANDPQLIQDNLRSNSLLDSQVLVNFSGNSFNVNDIDMQLNKLNADQLRGAVLGTGFVDGQLSVIVVKPSGKVVDTATQLPITNVRSATVTRIWNGDNIQDGLTAGDIIDADEVGPMINILDTSKLPYAKGSIISTDQLKWIYALLPGTSDALQGIKTYEDKDGNSLSLRILVRRLRCQCQGAGIPGTK